MFVPTDGKSNYHIAHPQLETRLERETISSRHWNLQAYRGINIRTHSGPIANAKDTDYWIGTVVQNLMPVFQSSGYMRHTLELALPNGEYGQFIAIAESEQFAGN